MKRVADESALIVGAVERDLTKGNTRKIRYRMGDVWVRVNPMRFNPTMNEARLSHLPFWGPSEDFFLIN